MNPLGAPRLRKNRGAAPIPTAFPRFAAWARFAPQAAQLTAVERAS
jgi:hypothetical protein